MVALDSLLPVSLLDGKGVASLSHRFSEGFISKSFTRTMSSVQIPNGTGLEQQVCILPQTTNSFY